MKDILNYGRKFMIRLKSNKVFYAIVESGLVQIGPLYVEVDLR